MRLLVPAGLAAAGLLLAVLAAPPLAELFGAEACAAIFLVQVLNLLAGAVLRVSACEGAAVVAAQLGGAAAVRAGAGGLML